MPQLCAMSVAFEAHGEIVPKRGITKNSSVAPLGSVAVRRLAVGQHGVEAAGVVGRQRRAGIDEVDEARLDGGDMRGGRLQLAQEALATKCGQGIGTRQNQHGWNVG